MTSITSALGAAALSPGRPLLRPMRGKGYVAASPGGRRQKDGLYVEGQPPTENDVRRRQLVQH